MDSFLLWLGTLGPIANLLQILAFSGTVGFAVWRFTRSQMISTEAELKSTKTEVVHWKTEYALLEKNNAHITKKLQDFEDTSLPVLLKKMKELDESGQMTLSSKLAISWFQEQACDLSKVARRISDWILIAGEKGSLGQRLNDAQKWSNLSESLDPDNPRTKELRNILVALKAMNTNYEQGNYDVDLNWERLLTYVNSDDFSTDVKVVAYYAEQAFVENNFVVAELYFRWSERLYSSHDSVDFQSKMRARRNRAMTINLAGRRNGEVLVSERLRESLALVRDVIYNQENSAFLGKDHYDTLRSYGLLGSLLIKENPIEASRILNDTLSRQLALGIEETEIKLTKSYLKDLDDLSKGDSDTSL